MTNKIQIIALIGIVLTTALSGCEEQTPTNNGINGSPLQIQPLINKASTGDTITIPPGTYYENLIINKSITLQGENKQTTIIDGNNNENVITITAQHVQITGFTIQHSGENLFNAGIHIQTNYNIINNNIIANNSDGIHITSGSNNQITDNTFSDNNYTGIGIYSSTNNQIKNNNIKNNNYLGIYIWESSSNNTISNNVIIQNNDWGIHISQGYENNIQNNTITKNNNGGIVLHTPSNNNIIQDNTISFNTNEGIRIYASQNTITSNAFSENKIGISLHSSTNNLIKQNILSNKQGGIFIYEQSQRNLIYHNDFIKNIQHARDFGTNNSWDNGLPAGGNYWSNYDGEDTNEDGIGDTPYTNIDGGKQDRYPRIHPYNQ